MTTSSAHVIFFNRPDYQAMNMVPGETAVRLDAEVGGRLVASLCGVRKEDTVVIGHSAPYGGIDVARPSESASALHAAIDRLLSELRDIGVRHVAVRAKPDYFSANEPVLLQALFLRGFVIRRAEISLGLPLCRWNGMDAYLGALKSPARRCLHKALQFGLEYRRETDDDGWAGAYAVMAANRARRGVALKLSLDYVIRLRQAHSSRVRMMTLRHEERPVAAALIYRLAADVEYVVAWGDADHELAQSPMNLLAYLLVEEGLAGGMRLLDLGISSVDGIPDDGLVQFKRHIGATTGLRLDLELELG